MPDRKLLAHALSTLLAAVGGTTTYAQESPPGQDASPLLEEVIVTAQRRAESVQDVPMTLTAISAEEVQDYNIFRFDDLEQLSPGLSLDSQGAFGSVAQLRGVGFDSNASTAPAVDIYYNDTPVDANFAFQSIYDIGQVEVLRGPQGTLRGRPSPAGAITLTSRRPDLDGIGGYVSGSAGDEGTYNVQGAVNVPVIQDRLALRVAGVYDEDEGNRVKSINSGEETERETKSWRASIRWAVTDSFEATLTHQWLESDRVALSEVEGPGYGDIGPAIGDRKGLSVMETRSGGTQKSKITNLNAVWELNNHRIVYNGAYQDNSYSYNEELDIYNAVTDFLEYQSVPTTFEVNNHELRLESTGPDQFVDYLVGLWYYDDDIDAGFSQPAPQPGAFGNPLTPSPIGPPDSDYVIDVDGGIPVDSENIAIYTNLDFHLTDNTDLSVGLRYLENDNKRTETIRTSDALIAVGIAPGVPVQAVCESLIALDVGFNGEEPWPGYCQLELAAAVSESPGSAKDDEWVYAASLSHHFGDDLMAYFRYDHSWRPAGVTVGLTAPVTDPDLVQGDPEESDSFELGLRSDWMGGRLRINAAVFRQEFDNYIGYFPDIPFVGAGEQIVAAPGFTYPGDATVDGVDLDITAQLADAWWAQLTVAYSDGRYDDARVPCRDTNGDGRPDDGDIGNLTLDDFRGPDGEINSVIYCEVDDAISTIPNWVAMLQSEYTFGLFSEEGYARVLYNYYGEQDNLPGVYEADAYGVLNLFVGLRDDSARWEVALWARNLLDEDNQLQRGKPQTSYGAFETGYYQVAYVPEREIGITLRYLFGGG